MKTQEQLEAEVRRLTRLLTDEERKGEVVDRIVDAIKDSISASPEVTVPVLPELKEAKYDETAVLLLSDVHIGKKTPTYDPKVFAKRLRKLEQALLSVVTALRSQRPIKKLVVVMMGDIVDNESIYPSQAVDKISIPVLDQIFSVGLPELTSFLMFCLSNFEKVEVQATRGNHGAINQAKWVSSKSTNWDFVLYRALQTATANQDRLKWVIADRDWKVVFKVEGEGFLACHGNMIKRYYSLPFYGMTRQMERWQNAYRDKFRLTNFCFGHFHSACAGMRFNQGEIFLNGSFVTDDDFAEEVVGVASVPEQVLLGVHPRFGVSWRYVLQLK